MDLEGRLDRLDFADLLQMLGSGGRSGKLTVTQYGGQGLVVLRKGKIIYAATNSARETLGNMLLCKKLISEEDLAKGLELQARATEERRLGSILVSHGLLSQEDLESVISEQVGKAVAEFLEWNDGFFRFEEFELPDRGEVGIDATDLLLDEGLGADEVLLSFFHRFDSEGAQPEPRTADDDGPIEEPTEDSITGILQISISKAGRRSDTRSTSLKSIIAELHSPEFTCEVTLGLLRYCQEIVRRGVLFRTGRSGISGMGQFGYARYLGCAPDFVRQITMPLGQSSVLTEAVARKSVFLGPLEETAANRYLVRRLGGAWPKEVVTAPLIVHGRALLIFYGENLPGNEPIGPSDNFEVVLAHAGLAIEKNLLAKRVEYLESLDRGTMSDQLTSTTTLGGDPAT